MTEQQLLILEEHNLTPLKKVLDASLSSHPNPQKNTPSIKESLDTLFPEQQHEEKQIKKAKEILGTLSEEFTEVQLRDAITEIQFLTEYWLDDFERQIFHGVTLQELLHEKGGT